MKKSAIFLDRDGTIIEEKNYLSKLEDIHLFKDVPNALKQLQQKGFLLLLVTNQSAIAKGYIEENFVEVVFSEINNQLKNCTVQLDAQFYCPHHPAGRSPYNLDCNCRKPKTGMINEASKIYPIDLKTSWVLGDKASDIQMALKVGCKSALVLTGYGKKELPRVEKYKETKILKKFSDILKFL